MPALGEQLQTIGMMAAHEAAMSDLYQLYSEQLPEHTDLFTNLATSERAHARAIASFADAVRTRLAEVNVSGFNAAAILTSLDIVRARLADAKQTPASASLALSVALEIEESLLEKDYLLSVTTESPELLQLLQRLSQETQAHRNALLEAWTLTQETERNS